MTADARLDLPVRTEDDGDPEIRDVLVKAKKSVGFVPNMYRGMANAPGLLDTYLDGYARFRESSGFSPAEQEVVFLTISRSNGCSYCMAAHSMIATRKSEVPAPVLAAIRANREIPDPKLSALATFTLAMVESRGLPLHSELEAFRAAGYGDAHALQIVLAIAVKTLSNFSNHLTRPEIDPVFAEFALETA